VARRGVFVSAPQPRRKQRHKPKKPYASFPLTSHNNGPWCKNIRGKIHFFGVWEDPEAAHRRYIEVAPELHAGRPPHQTVSADGCTVKDACDHYLTFQVHKLEAGEFTARSFEDYHNAAESFARFVGHSRAIRDLSPDDFQQYHQKLTRSGVPAKGRGLGVYALIAARRRMRGRLRTAGYRLSQRTRKKVEEAFGWIKQIGGLARMRLVGRWKKRQQFQMVAAAYNLVRLSRLLSG
jgi:hypothetical protein